ncbi:Non-heme 11 kDa protein of cytochrome bc1 complex [Tilletiaria anomala UBC 951]|uniref:Non-heme 11 kDa protein of cytochrome bc1 complex n=1 Tax=Tilletiaria anomala (strain ATCC 24038 / CBS 436.72 / UBC 951) TaxID=1037660 RepID=A0A066VMG7_TILAU|nr:Non-heme 11 kDa protein of cytochrome bc1 complex [Tilletiaria anomala UBC 951]KDN39949.1 Non-heme 11 kDa protein of cytochrome bc1 complex [Tilletiaria anomala UBC 951]
MLSAAPSIPSPTASGGNQLHSSRQLTSDLSKATCTHSQQTVDSAVCPLESPRQSTMSSSSVTSAVSALEESSLMGSISSFISSFFPVAHAEEGEGEDGDSGEEEEDDDEPEDPQETIYADCENSKACAPAKHHFDACQSRVQEGKGFKGEDCIEEFFHLAHCASECTAPKLFKRLV